MKKLARLLFKPKWQDKDPAVRRTAIAELRDIELIAVLPQIAREDADAEVRIAALKRIDDYETWRERSTGDADGQVRAAARRAYLALLCSSDDSRLPPLTRRVAELETLSSTEIDEIASRASNRDLRGAALERVTRQSLLAERALADPDARLRAATLERIHDIGALERIAERARKTDKAIYRRARELAERLRIGSGDAQAIAEKALLLCTRAETLLRSAQAQDVEARGAMEQEWQRLGSAVPLELQGRFRGALALLRQMHADLLEPKRRSDAATPPDEETAATAETVAAAVASIDLLAAQAKVHASLAAATEAAKRERELQRTRLRETEQLVEQYAVRLDAGDVSAAHESHATLASKLASLGDTPATLAARVAPLQARYAELAHWQRWSNDQRRQALCAEIEALPGAGLHPDALATRVRAAREEWQRLDAAQGAGDRESGLARRFNALCHRVLKPTKTYFEKRDAVRRSHADEIKALLQASAALPDDSIDWKSASALRKQLGDALRGLDAVEPRERTELAKRLKEAIATLAARIDGHAAGIESARGRLIERAAALGQGAELRDAARAVRELQREWTALGQGRRAADQRQWNEFRKHCDAVFGKLDAARNERAAADAATRAEADVILAQIEAVHRDAAQPLDASQAALRALAARWQTLPSPERNIEQRYRKAYDDAARRLQDAMRAKRLSRFTSALHKYALLRQLESGAVAHAEATSWAASPSTADALAQALDTRFDRARSAASTPTEDAAARARLVELEFLAGVETPDEDRDLRMQHQLQRLASRMRERAGTAPDAELARILTTWFAQAPQTDALERRFALAAQAAVSSLP